MNITDQFPTGQWNDANSHFVVRVGCYWEAVAVREGTGITLTPLGQSLVAPVEVGAKEEVSTLDPEAAIGNELGGELNLDDLPDLSPSKTLKKKRGLG